MPWSRLHLDFLGPIFNQKYLVIIEACSKWLEVFKMHSTNAQSTIQVLRTLFSRMRLPDKIVTDNGPPSRSKEF